MAARDPAQGMLLTDQYQLTMAQLYFREGLHEGRARFDYFYRSNPDYGDHQAGYCVFAGLGPLLDWMSSTAFNGSDIDRLRSQSDGGGTPRFGEDFLSWLEAEGRFTGTEMRGLAEGRVLHPHVPALTVEGPLAVLQVLETPLLNHLNYPTLIATKAARVRHAARGRPVLEFGTRRGPASGASAGVRAALIGGADFTSNVAVSHALGLDPKGTHAHSMIQAFVAAGGSELDAFRAYGRTYPDNCLLLVDTIDTLNSGLPHAIEVFRELEAAGHDPVGIRLDSGDLAHLAVRAADALDRAGFVSTAIVLSSDLDELEIVRIRGRIEAESAAMRIASGAVLERLVYGVGTRLITSHGAPALGGVFKLAALEADGQWRPAFKRSDTPAKTPLPGIKEAWRIYDTDGVAQADVVGQPGEAPVAAEPFDGGAVDPGAANKLLAAQQVSSIEPLHEDLFRSGMPVAEPATLEDSRRRRAEDVARLPEAVQKLTDPETYDVLLTEGLDRLRASLLDSANGEMSL